MSQNFILEFDEYTGYEYMVFIYPTITHKRIEFRNAVIYEKSNQTVYVDDNYTFIIPRDFKTCCIFYDKKLGVNFRCGNPMLTPISDN